MPEMTIYKFKIEAPDLSGISRVTMPINARVISAGVQGDDIMVWAMVNPKEADKNERRFQVVGTGRPLAKRMMQFIDTVFMGSLVFHVFEVID